MAPAVLRVVLEPPIVTAAVGLTVTKPDGLIVTFPAEFKTVFAPPIVTAAVGLIVTNPLPLKFVLVPPTVTEEVGLIVTVPAEFKTVFPPDKVRVPAGLKLSILVFAPVAETDAKLTQVKLPAPSLFKVVLAPPWLTGKESP